MPAGIVRHTEEAAAWSSFVSESKTQEQKALEKKISQAQYPYSVYQFGPVLLLIEALILNINRQWSTFFLLCFTGIMSIYTGIKASSIKKQIVEDYEKEWIQRPAVIINPYARFTPTTPGHENLKPIFDANRVFPVNSSTHLVLPHRRPFC